MDDIQKERDRLHEEKVCFSKEKEKLENDRQKLISMIAEKHKNI